MAKPKLVRKKIADYSPALVNPNAGNEHSVSTIQESIQHNGAGRPMLADKDGELIVGLC